jgi:archaellum component FlaC
MIAEAIKKINPNAKFHCIENDINSIQWSDDTTPIPITDIQDKINELQAEYDANQYQRDRAKEYPSIQEQLDMQYWDSVNGTTTWQDKINEIKIKYPKA